MQEYKEKIVLISGGLGDIGMAIGRAYLDAGAKVLFSDLLSSEQAKQKLCDIGAACSEYDYMQVDVSDHEQVMQWIDRATALYGHIDISIVNAAQVTLKNFQNLSFEEWKKEQSVNLDGAFFTAQASAQAFASRQIKGNIVFLGSWAAHAVHRNLPAYSVSKAAVRMLCQCMALEYAELGIRVNEIAPGYVNAGLSKVVWQDSPDSRLAAKDVVPSKEIIESEDVARQVLWVTSEHNKHMTGATILMDGGLSLWRP